MIPRRATSRRRALTPVLRDVGGILLIAAIAMVCSAAVAAIYRDWWTLAWFVVSAAVTAATGLGTRHLFRAAPQAGEREALSIATAAWLAMTVFGGVPFILAAHLTPDAVIASYVPAGVSYTSSSLLHFRDPLHAFFEAMSGWTSTGLTMAVNEASMPHAFLFYRSLMQWIGGLGIIVLALTVIQQHGGVQGLYLYQTEARPTRIRPSMRETARRVWRIYVAITGGVVLYLFAAMVILLPDYPVTAAIFDAINHAMTGMATGGFSTQDDSIAGYGSYAIEVVHLLPMIIGAVALPVHYIALRERRPSAYLNDVQNRTMVGLLVVGSSLVAWALVGAPAIADPTREGVFQFTSALTTTGWQTSDIGQWEAAAVLIVVVAMVLGGPAGSTVGALKLLRVNYLARGVWWQVTQVFYPSSAVTAFRIGDRTFRRDEMEAESGRAALFALMWFVGLFVSVVLMTLTVDASFSLADMVFESATAQGTVGLSSGITDPSMPTSVEAMFIVQMLFGRLEIVPVMVFVRMLVWPRR